MVRRLSRGNLRVNLAPWPPSERTLMLPPCLSTIRLTTERSIPAPPALVLKNGLKIKGGSSDEMPRPVSEGFIS